MREKRNSIEAVGTQVAFVHMATEEDARVFFEKQRLPDVVRISDPEQELYRAFELGRARMGKFLRPLAFWHVFKTAVLNHYGIGGIAGDTFQMPGVFLLRQGKVLKSHRYREPWDHPDFEQMAHAVANSS